MTKRLFYALGASASLLLANAANAETQTVRGAIPEAVARWQLLPIGRLAATNQLRLAIGFPVRDPDGLKSFLEDMYTPGNPSFRKYLTPEQFTERFGPSQEDYQTVIDYVTARGLKVTRPHRNRLLLDVAGNVPEIERAFHLTLYTYVDPIENRQFYAPDAEPTLDFPLPILQIDGLNNYARPISTLRPSAPLKNASPRGGSGYDGLYAGLDYRNAYAPGATLDGTGQYVGLVEFAGYYAGDVTNYEAVYGLPQTPLINVAVDGDVVAASSGGEAPGDIEMAVSMATNLSAVVSFQATGQSTMASWNDMLNLMAASNQIKQFSCSYRLPSLTTSNVVGDQIFQEMGVQGQSFFKASGDGDAFVVPIPWPNDNPYITLAGGTQLSMNGSGVSYLSESVWNSGLEGSSWGGNGDEDYWGSGGGVSKTYALPGYQAGLSMLLNGGSTTMRNLPDVAMAADHMLVYYDNGYQGGFGGTSFASPLWAGFTALVNQKASSLGLPSVGFANPAIYAIGRGPNYTSCFNDITTGNNEWPGSPTSYVATNGYDLCTGWGSPTGTNLIGAMLDQLAGGAGPTIATASISGDSLTLIGVGGPSGGSYTLLVTTNLALPMSQWKTNSNTAFDLYGTSSNVIEVSAAIAGRYFRIRIP